MVNDPNVKLEHQSIPVVKNTIQSNSVITNSSGPDKFVRYNREVFYAKDIVILIKNTSLMNVW